MSISNEGPVGTLERVGIDVADMDQAARFWEGLLGVKVANRGDKHLMFERQGDGPSLYVQEVPEKKTAKTRLHFDIAVENLDTTVARSVVLGAKQAQSYAEGGRGHVVMEDPDGNEFCLTLM